MEDEKNGLGSRPRTKGAKGRKRERMRLETMQTIFVTHVFERVKNRKTIRKIHSDQSIIMEKKQIDGRNVST